MQSATWSVSADAVKGISDNLMLLQGHTSKPPSCLQR